MKLLSLIIHTTLKKIFKKSIKSFFCRISKPLPFPLTWSVIPSSCQQIIARSPSPWDASRCQFVGGRPEEEPVIE